MSPRPIKAVRVSPAGLSIAAWAPGDTAGTRPVCTSVGPAVRGAWTSDDPDARALARESCKSCPIRLTCLRLALESKVTAGVFGGYSFTSAGERKLAQQEIDGRASARKQREASRRAV